VKENYKPVGKYIRVINQRNTDLKVKQLIGLSIDKCYITSVANIIGTDLSNYKVIKRNQFACSLMQVSRDGKIPIACMKEYDEAIMSPAYVVFEIINENEVLPDYLSMWFMRSEFDREASFLAVGGVRGSLAWDDFCGMKFPLVSIKKQINTAKIYKLIVERIILKKKINDILEATLDTVFLESFFVQNSQKSTKLGEIISFSNGKSRPKTSGNIPVYGGNGILSYTDQSNAENTVLIGRVGAYCGSVYFERGSCWVSDNAIYAKSKICSDEYFDYFLLRGLNLFNHHVGTGQQLLTQDILNSIEIAKPDFRQIENFNMKAKAIFDIIAINRTEILYLQHFLKLLLAQLAS
jgi:type I restriction enzyme S subunit